MNDIASKQISRWGGECYDNTCPYHFHHEPLCDAESFVITDETFKRRAKCQLARLPNKPLELPQDEH